MAKYRVARVVSLSILLSMVGAACDDRDETPGSDQAAVVAADGGIPRRSMWSYWDRGGDLGSGWRAGGFDDSGWARAAGPLGYGESYLSTTVGYGGDAAHKYTTTYVRTQFTVADPTAVRAIRGDLMFDDGVVVYLNGHEIGRASMPGGAVSAGTFALGHEANNAYQSYDWSAQRPLLVAGVNTIAVEIHQADASSSDLVFDLGLVLDVAAPPPGNLARGSTWSYWDRGGDLGSAWRAGGYDASAWARGAGPLGYGESYLHTTVGYGGNPSAKYITSYFRGQFSVADPAQVTSMIGELMYDDGLVVYLNGHELDRQSMPAGAVTAATRAAGHEAGNAYLRRDWSGFKSFLVAGVNTIAVEVHQADPTSSDLVFDLSLTLGTAPPPPPPVSDDLPRGSVWKYWDRGGDLGSAWRARGFDDSGWVSAAGPLGYGETYLHTTIGYGPDPANKYITTYFRGSFYVEDPAKLTRVLVGLMHDDGVVAYVNGQEVMRLGMPAGAITASTLASDWESGNVYEQYDWLPSVRPMLVAGQNTIAIEVHQAAASSDDLTFDLELTDETATREPTTRGIAAGSTWGTWDRGDDLGNAWRAAGYPENFWSAGAAPLGFGEAYIATTTRSGPITTYFRHDFTLNGSPSEWALEAKYDDGFVAYLNGTEVLRVGLPAGAITASTLAANHEAGAYERFALPGAAALVVQGVNTLAIEVHQSSTTSSDLVWDARLVTDNRWPVAWTRQASGTTAQLTGVWFTDAQHGWAVGAQATLLHTSDGGATWTAQAVGPAGDRFNAIEFADSQHGWIVGASAGVLATSDGGATWSTQAALIGYDLSFVDAQHGWIAGPDIYRTTDGATWQLVLSGNNNVVYNAIDFVDAQHGWAAGQVDAGGDGHTNGENIVLHTSDGGLTWQEQLGGGGFEQGFVGLDAVSDTFACVVGVGANHTQLGEYKFATRDGGGWNPLPDSSNGTSLYDVQFVDAQVGWAVGFAGSIVHTADGGASWTPQETARWEYFEDHSRSDQPSLFDVHFVDGQNGWAVGDDGTILVTHDGGRP